MDLSKVSCALGQPLRGVLGYSLLKGQIVQIDYPHRRVRFDASAPSCTGDRGVPSTCAALSFRYNDGILATGVTVDGKPVLANIDTSSSSTFQFTPKAVDKLLLREEVERAHLSHSVGFNGSINKREGKVHNVTSGSSSVNGPAVVFYGKGMGMDEEAWELRIGNGFLKDFAVKLDYVHGRITLAKPVAVTK